MQVVDGLMPSDKQVASQLADRFKRWLSHTIRSSVLVAKRRFRATEASWLIRKEDVEFVLAVQQTPKPAPKAMRFWRRFGQQYRLTHTTESTEDDDGDRQFDLVIRSDPVIRVQPRNFTPSDPAPERTPFTPLESALFKHAVDMYGPRWGMVAGTYPPHIC